MSSPFCSEHIAMTDEIFKRQEERGREGRRKKEKKENQEDTARLRYKIKPPWTRHKRKV